MKARRQMNANVAKVIFFLKISIKNGQCSFLNTEISFAIFMTSSVVKFWCITNRNKLKQGKDVSATECLLRYFTHNHGPGKIKFLQLVLISPKAPGDNLTVTGK